MRLLFPAILLLLASVSPALAQRSYVPLDQVRAPNGLTQYLEGLQELQLDSLKQFTTYLEARVQAHEVPEGVLLNVQAIYTESQLRATSDPVIREEKRIQLIGLYQKRKELDSVSPVTTWFGVDRVKLGEMMRSEYTAFAREVAAPPHPSGRQIPRR